MGKTVCIAFSGGCPRAQVDAARLHEYFAVNGWRLSDDYRSSDLIVLSGCAVASKQELRTMRAVAVAARKRRVGAQLVVIGCAAGIVDDRLCEEFGATVVPPVRIDELDDIIGAAVAMKDVPDPNDVEPHIHRALRPIRVNASTRLQRTMRRAKRTGRRILSGKPRAPEDFADLEPLHDVHSVRVSGGCLEDCTYCAIRIAMGTLRSKPLARVLVEFDQGLALRRTEFKLIGADVGAYGQDLGTSSAELLTALLGRQGDFKLTIHDFHPRWLVQYQDTLVPLVARNVERVRLLILPVQSGSDRVLERMGRRGSADELTRALTTLRSAAPGLVLGTHVLVGFPGETEEDFEATCRLLELVQFQRVDIYKYADRPKTPALAFTDKVSPEVKTARVERVMRDFPAAREYT